MSTTPTFKQMRVRNTGHIETLRKIATGQPLTTPQTRTSEARGIRTMLSTMLGWGVIETVVTEEPATGKRTYATQVTDRGREFLAWLDSGAK